MSFEEQSSTGSKSGHGQFTNSPIEQQGISIFNKQCDVRFEIPHLTAQRSLFATWHVGRIAHDQIDLGELEPRFENIHLGPLHLQVISLSIAPRYGQRFGRAIQAENLCLRERFLQRQCDASTAGADIEDTVRRAAFLQNKLHQLFGLGPGYQHTGCYMELQSVEEHLTENVLQWLAGLHALQRMVDLDKITFGERLLASEFHLRSIPTKGMVEHGSQNGLHFTGIILARQAAAEMAQQGPHLIIRNAHCAKVAAQTRATAGIRSPTLPTMSDRTAMQRALQIARLGAGWVAPNPVVGAVLVQGDHILAEGWHQLHGAAHAEVNCLRAFGDGPIPTDAVMYVTLEPCSHHGRTPPCCELLIARGVKHVVVAHADPFPAVSGKGISALRAAGVNVTLGMDEAEARWTNRRFLHSVIQERPYVILKWARSADGFLDKHPRTERGVQRISSPATDVLVHQWRSEEQAIMVGSRTVLHDNPALNVRHVAGQQPLRVVLDREGISPASSKVYDGSIPTLLFTHQERTGISAEQVLIPIGPEPIPAILSALHERNIRSVLVEGGAQLLKQFLASGLWDEARVIQGTPEFEQGTAAPELNSVAQRILQVGDDTITLHLNPTSFMDRNHLIPDEWPW